MKLEFTKGFCTCSIVVQKDPEGNYRLQPFENETLLQESAGINEDRRDEEVDSGQNGIASSNN
jgi:hypothetical protein